MAGALGTDLFGQRAERCAAQRPDSTAYMQEGPDAPSWAENILFFFSKTSIKTSVVLSDLALFRQTKKIAILPANTLKVVILFSNFTSRAWFLQRR